MKQITVNLSDIALEVLDEAIKKDGLMKTRDNWIEALIRTYVPWPNSRFEKRIRELEK